MTRRIGAVALAAAMLALAVPSARALDVELDSDASFQVYEVRAPGTTTFLARRRFTSNLGLRLVQPLGAPEPDGRQIRLSASVRLRLYHDFGEDCLVGGELCVRAYDREMTGGWQPLTSPSLIDLPMLWVAIDGLPLGIAARVGRQLEVDPIGFVRFDGVSARIAPWPWISAEAFAGLMVRGTSLLGTPAFEPQGEMRVDRSDVDATVAPWTDPGIDTWVVGARVRGGPGEWLQLGAGVRHAWEDDGTVLSRLSLSATSQPIPLLRMEAIGVLDLLDITVIDALGAIELREGIWSARASIERHVPRFDPGTIWAWFQTAPIDEARLGGSVRLSDDVELGGALRGRHADLGAPWGEDYDAGVEGWARARIERIDAGLSGFAWSGSLGPVAGVSIDARRRLIPEIALGLHVSVWHFDDPLRQDLYGTVVSESIDAIFDLTEQASILVELQHAASRVVGNRFRLIAWLRVETWR
ncbi:hypothetical protein [Sandaracinus amylolyticus]|uniref:hypothetical protein n=1 Tax=Sandaracinus amylolyticus TaxID=927083 RepID=UPI001F3438E1|nr:hypothetical protein [Sandaracinus amylolyticus]